MNVEVLETFYWTVQGRHVFPGEVIRVKDEVGRDLIEHGYAKQRRKPGRPPSHKAAKPTEDK